MSTEPGRVASRTSFTAIVEREGDGRLELVRG
jgi:hypothetical protein